MSDEYSEINIRKLEIDITARCNLKCFNCDRLCSQAPSNYIEPLPNICKVVDETIALNYRWEKVKIMGGEPTLHPQIISIINYVDKMVKLGLVDYMEIVTNGIGPQVPDVCHAIPDAWHLWNTFKTDRFQPEHAFITLAPIDLGIYTHPVNGCGVPNFCGLGYSRGRYYPCGVAIAIDRVLHIDKYIPTLAEITVERMMDIADAYCRYCGHYTDAVLFGRHRPNRVIPYTEVEPRTQTWENVLKAYHDNGT